MDPQAMKAMAQGKAEVGREAKPLDPKSMHAMAADRVHGMNDIYMQTLGKESHNKDSEGVRILARRSGVHVHGSRNERVQHMVIAMVFRFYAVEQVLRKHVRRLRRLPR